MSMGSETGVPWKLAPVRMSESLSGMKIGLSPTPLSSISTWVAAQATASWAAPMTCGRGAHGVGVLDLRLDLAAGQVGALDAAPDGGGAAHRPGEAAQLVQAGVVGLEVGQERLEAHGAGDLGLAQPARRRRRGAGRSCAVSTLEPLMVARPSRACRPGMAMPARSMASLVGQALAAVERLAFAHQRQGELGHGGEVAAGAHRALLADHRGDALVEHRDEGLGDLGADRRSCRGRGR